MAVEHPIAIFEEGDVRDAFLLADVSVVSSAYLATAVPERAMRESSVAALPSESAASGVFGCVHDGCTKEFVTHRAMMTHYRFAHDVRHVVANLVVTNQCPRCMQVFSTRVVAQRHAVRVCSGEGGTCHDDLVHWSYALQRPARAVCPICAQEFDLLEHLQVHVRTHHRGPLAFTTHDRRARAQQRPKRCRSAGAARARAGAPRRR